MFASLSSCCATLRHAGAGGLGCARRVHDQHIGRLHARRWLATRRVRRARCTVFRLPRDGRADAATVRLARRCHRNSLSQSVRDSQSPCSASVPIVQNCSETRCPAGQRRLKNCSRARCAHAPRARARTHWQQARREIHACCRLCAPINRAKWPPVRIWAWASKILLKVPRPKTLHPGTARAATHGASCTCLASPLCPRWPLQRRKRCCWRCRRCSLLASRWHTVTLTATRPLKRWASRLASLGWR